MGAGGVRLAVAGPHRDRDRLPEFVVGANDFEALFRDTRFLNSIWNTAIIIGPALVLELLVGLGLALLLTRIGHGRPIAAAFLPSPSWCRR